MAQRLFGHTAFTHQLPTSEEIAHVQYGVKVGDKVAFDFEGRKITGVLHKVHKRAIVMVAHEKGKFVDEKGKRHTKFYVPLAMLK